MVWVDLLKCIYCRKMASLNDKQRPSQWLLNKFIHALDIILKCSFHFASSKRGFSITDANQNKTRYIFWSRRQHIIFIQVYNGLNVLNLNFKKETDFLYLLAAAIPLIMRLFHSIFSAKETSKRGNIHKTRRKSWSLSLLYSILISNWSYLFFSSITAVTTNFTYGHHLHQQAWPQHSEILQWYFKEIQKS